MNTIGTSKRCPFVFTFQYSTDPHSAVPVKRAYDRIFAIAYQKIIERKNKTEERFSIIEESTL